MKQLLYLPSVFLLVCILVLSGWSTSGTSVEEKDAITSLDAIENGSRFLNQGWICVHLEGDAYERGVQHGYYLADEIVDMIRHWSNVIHNYREEHHIKKELTQDEYDQVSGRWWEFSRTVCQQWYWDKYPEEYQQELQGIADGLAMKNKQIFGRTITAQDILTNNQMYEMLSKFERIPMGIHPIKTFFHQITQEVPSFWPQSSLSFYTGLATSSPPHHCSGFVATGDATTHGQMIISDAVWCGPGSWWWTYYISLRWNIIFDVIPTTGYRFQMASAPGYIWSDHDFYQNQDGIAFIETTVPQGLFDFKGLPLSVRARTAVQYASSIDDVIASLRYRNDGCMNAVWLIGDADTGEIARYELGYIHDHTQRTFNGFFWSANNPENFLVRLEKFDAHMLIKTILYKVLFQSPGFGYYSLFYRPETRDVAFEQLGNQYFGDIDVDVVKYIMTSSPVGDWSTDTKITDTTLIKNNGFCAFFGNPQGNILNITNIDHPAKTIEQIPPHGWTRFFKMPTGGISLDDTPPQPRDSLIDPAWTLNLEESTNTFSTTGQKDDNTLYLASSTGSLYAVNTSSQLLEWETPIGEHPSDLIVNDTILIIAHEDGVELFNHQGLSDYLFDQIISCTSLCQIGNVLIAGSKNKQVTAVHIQTKEVLWKNSYSYETYVSESALDTVYVTSDTTCYAIDTLTGEERWNITTDGPCTSSAILYGDTVYVGSWDGSLYAINASTGELQWSYSTGWGIATSPTVDSSQVYVASMDHHVYALDRINGELIWSFECRAGIHTSPALSNNMIFIASDDGRLYNVNKTTGVLRWCFTPGYSVGSGSFNYQSTPLLSTLLADDSSLYLTALGSLYALAE